MDLKVTEVGYDFRDRSSNLIECQITDNGLRQAVYTLNHSVYGGIFLDLRCVIEEVSFTVVYICNQLVILE